MNNAKKPGDDAGSDRTGNGPSAKEQDASKKHVERIVLQYLQSKGYKSAEQALREEADLNAGENNEISLEELAKMFPTDETSDDVNVPSWILMYNQAEQGNPDAYGQSYSSLRRWIDMSLDIYKNELFAVSYPLFVHSFLDLMARDLCEKGTEFLQKYKDDHLVLHSDDIKQLSTIKSPQHVKENELAKLFRNNKYCLKLSNVGLELLLTFLQEHKFMLLLRIVNQYLSIQTREGAASAGSIEDADIGITGHTQHQIDQFNSQAVTLGPLSMNPMLREETEQTLRMQLKGQKHKEGGKKAQEEAKSLLGDFNKGQFNFGLDPIPADSILAPPPRGPDVAAQIQRLKDARKRVVLGPAALPSICMYTIHNTSDSLNCTTVSDDLSIMAGGFSESYVKLWSLKHKPLEGQSDFAWSLQPDKDGDTERPRNHSNDYNRRLIGHSGPVFGLDISFDNKYLISCSEDKTARLWSLDTYTNVVCYKGHNFPVWDVAFGPFSFYFATASHDRTARLWSCDHIYPLRIFAGHLSDVNCVRFHPNSKYIVTGSCDKTARLWDVQRGSCVRVFTGHKDSVGTVAVSPDGRIMASAGYENTIRVWDLGSGRCMSEFSGHTGSIYSLAFSQEGTLLLSGSADQTVRAWDVKRRADSSIHPIIAQKKQNAEDVLNIQRETEDDVSALNGSKMDIGSPTKSEKEAENDKDAANKKPAAKKRDAEGRWKASRVVESEQLLKTWKTKSTPVYSIKFSKRNLAVAVGAFKI